MSPNFYSLVQFYSYHPEKNQIKLRSKYLIHVQLEVKLQPFKEKHVRQSLVHHFLYAITILSDDKKELDVRMAGLVSLSFPGQWPPSYHCS